MALNLCVVSRHSWDTVWLCYRLLMLAGVRRQLEEARATLTESAAFARAGEVDPAYRAALRSRNLLFHATRGLAAARGLPLPEMPVVAGAAGAIEDHEAAVAALDQALAATDELAQMPALLDGARQPYARYLGFLRAEVGRLLRG